MHPKQIPKADSKNKNERQIKQLRPVIMLYEFTITRRKNIRPARPMPIFHANFFWAAPTYSGTCLFTIKRPSINVGEYFGFTKTRMIRSVRKIIRTYLIIKKFSLKRISIKEMNRNRKRIPADALISLSFKTGIVYPSTSSPNPIILFALFIFKILKQGTEASLVCAWDSATAKKQCYQSDCKR